MVDDGGPAFPVTINNPNNVLAGGMSLRDWFAGQSLSGQLAHSKNVSISYEEFASDAYKMADAMLLERQRRA